MLSQNRSKGNKTKLMINISRQSLCDDTLLPWLTVAFKAADLPSDVFVFQSNEVDVTSHLNKAKPLHNVCRSENPCYLSPIRITCYDSRLCAPAILSILSLKHAPSRRKFFLKQTSVQADNPSPAAFVVSVNNTVFGVG